VGTWVEDLERVLEGLALERVTLVGQSVGSMVAEQAAVRLGDRVGALMVIGGALRWRPESGPVFEERVRLARAGRMEQIAESVAATGLSERCRQENPALHGLFCELIASNDPGCYAQWAAATAVAEMTEPGRVRCPALVACGELDPVAPPAFAEAIAAAIPDARTAVIDGAAHWCQLEAPEAVNEALLGFLREIAT
jgi:3-oxoadipate enol-lactonase